MKGTAMSAAQRIGRTLATAILCTMLGTSSASGAARQARTVHELGTVTNDPLDARDIARSIIGLSFAWTKGARGEGVTIAIVDSGVDADHPDLVGRVLPGAQFVSDGLPNFDWSNHGTHVAGIAAAASDNGIGIAGVAPAAQILPVRVLDATGTGTEDNAAAGIRYAADHGAAVINLSIGTALPSPVIRAALRYARAKGSIPVCAAGNSGGTRLEYPARYSECIAVGSIDQQTLERATFSNMGRELDIVAPGVDVMSTVPEFERGIHYARATGTSMSAPFVSGALAALRGYGFDAANAARVLETTATDLGPEGRDDAHGAGLVDLGAALGSPTPIRAVLTLTAGVSCGSMQHPCEVHDGALLRITGTARPETYVRDAGIRVVTDWRASARGRMHRLDAALATVTSSGAVTIRLRNEHTQPGYLRITAHTRRAVHCDPSAPVTLWFRVTPD